MPGITGIFGSLGPDDNAWAFQRMVQPMLHEDFYSSGTYLNRELGIFSGFVSANPSHPPALVWNEADNIGCFISGEPLIASSHPSDIGSALIRLYEEGGLDALEKLNGWFSGLLVDLRHRQVVLFNDRYGLNRIYVHQQSSRLFFSSEAKSLLAVLPELRELDTRGLAEWLSCGCVLGNRTLFCGIYLLPPGSAWIFSADGAVKKKNYFNPHDWEDQPVLSPEDYYQQLTKVFPRILKHYTNGAEPLAMSLTGGLDGRMIMAWARPNHGQLPCYTFNGSYRDCADLQIARKVAVACGQPHQTISVGDEFLAQFPQLAEQTVYISDGAMDVSGAAELYVNRLARQIAPMRLTGNYGSEILRGNVAFRPRPVFDAVFDAEVGEAIKRAGNTYTEESRGNLRSFIAFKQLPWHHFARSALEKSELIVRSPYLDNELVALSFQAPEADDANFDACLRLIADGNSKLARIPTDRGIQYGANTFLNRLRRSKEQFLARAEYAYDYGMPGWLARVDSLLSPLRLERLFLGRQKFCHFRTWYRDQLAGCVKDVLLGPVSRSRPYLDAGRLEEVVSRHLAGTHNFTSELHKLISLELLHRTLLD